MPHQDRYEHIPFEDDSLPIRINYNSIISCTESPIPSWHEQLELLYFHKGGATVYCGDKCYTVSDGDLIIVNPYEMHRLSCNDRAEYDCIMISANLYRAPLEGICEKRYFNFLSDGQVRFNHYIPSGSPTIELVKTLSQEYLTKDYGYEISVKAYVYALLSSLFRNHTDTDFLNNKQSRNIHRYDRIKPAIKYMQTHIDTKVSLTELAHCCNMSPAHFCRLFKQITCTTPVQYFNNLRLHKAAFLLKQTDKSVAEVAMETGFFDVGYLSRLFKSRFGLTPIQAKKQQLY